MFIRKLIVSVGLFLIPVGVAVLVILFGPRTYHSESLMLLRLGRENVAIDPTAATGEVLHVQTNRDSEMKSILGILSSREIAKDVVGALGAEAINRGALQAEDAEAAEENRPKALESISKMKSQISSAVKSLDPIDETETAMKELYSGIRFESSDRNSNIVKVEYQAKSPELAQRVVTEWVNSFLRIHPEVNRATGSLDFFQVQLDHLRGQLEAARESLRKNKDEAGVVTVADQQRILSEQISSTVLRESTLVASLAAATTRAERLRELIESTDSRIIIEERKGIANAATDGMRQQLYDLEIAEQGLQTRYTENHPMVQAIESQVQKAARIVSAQDTARNEVVEGTNPAYLRVYEQYLLEQANRDAIFAELGSVRDARAGLAVRATELNLHEGTILDSQQQVQILEQRYAEIHAKMEEARLDEELQDQRITSINIVQPASLEYQPVSPRKSLCALLGLMGGIAGASAPWLLTFAPPALTGSPVDRTASTRNGTEPVGKSVESSVRVERSVAEGISSRQRSSVPR